MFLFYFIHVYLFFLDVSLEMYIINDKEELTNNKSSKSSLKHQIVWVSSIELHNVFVINGLSCEDIPTFFSISSLI